MAYTVEDGSGVAGATTYFAIATADAYWTARPHDALGLAWLAEAVTAKKQGAGLEASAYLDATWGHLYPGWRKTGAQGLLFPRVYRTVLDRNAYDTIEDMEAAQAETDRPLVGNDGLEMAALPLQIVNAAIELAARALTSPLAADKGEEGWLKRKRTRVEGAVDTETEYGSGGVLGGSYGFVDDMLAQVLIGKRNASWAWA